MTVRGKGVVVSGDDGTGGWKRVIGWCWCGWMKKKKQKKKTYTGDTVPSWT